MMKNRGVYWRKQSEKFVVSFKSNGKAKTYGLFASFDDAVKRAEEVWPTLPIANRSQRVCDCCGLKKSNQMFYWAKKTCKQCWKAKREEPWNRWAKSAATKLGKYSRRKHAETEWSKWARVKKAIICNRVHGRSIKVARKVPTSWDQWTQIERQRFMSNVSRRNRIGWDRKTKQWANSLIQRELKRLRRMNCET